ncbi:hypothetical protein ATG_06230 [Desulfurococcaceae archaeon AG1]|nr:hypothetical protein ATG_06230 [Desulfurococcaceae archaeon AG1]
MLGSLRELVWRSTWDSACFNALREMYVQSCGEHYPHPPLFEDLPSSLPHRFSAILSMVSEAMICGLREGGKELGDYLEKLREELLKLYSDLLLEEREYGLRLRPHRIEDLLRILAEKQG